MAEDRRISFSRMLFETILRCKEKGLSCMKTLLVPFMVLARLNNLEGAFGVLEDFLFIWLAEKNLACIFRLCRGSKHTEWLASDNFVIVAESSRMECFEVLWLSCVTYSITPPKKFVVGYVQVWSYYVHKNIDK